MPTFGAPLLGALVTSPLEGEYMFVIPQMLIAFFFSFFSHVKLLQRCFFGLSNLARELQMLSPQFWEKRGGTQQV